MIERYVENLYVGDDFLAKGEYAGGFIFLHCDLFKKDVSTMKRIRQAILETLEQARGLGYNKPLFAYLKDGRFARAAGGEYCTNFTVDGEEYQMYKWE